MNSNQHKSMINDVKNDLFLSLPTPTNKNWKKKVKIYIDYDSYKN